MAIPLLNAVNGFEQGSGKSGSNKTHFEWQHSEKNEVQLIRRVRVKKERITVKVQTLSDENLDDAHNRKRKVNDLERKLHLVQSQAVGEETFLSNAVLAIGAKSRSKPCNIGSKKAVVIVLKDPKLWITVMSLSQEGRSMRNIRSYDQSRTKPILGDEQMSRSALLGTPQLSKGDRLTGLGLRDGNVSDTKVRYRPERSARRSEPEWTGGISKKQETTRSRTAVVGMAERELRRRDRRSGDATEERTRARREQGHNEGDVKRQ
ncbi:hypothetical protein B0H16DRAFT_1698798 [Mycena metata]|uniref:Uncharacterized protein n=1 Tax=Mycena metata TaxID=1033252 RepID=A0AAD7HMT3_9AGAR|nr:hypothetical protein B0H16DRAFT_1698798 [Mycena metata]